MNFSDTPASARPEPTDHEIRLCAYHLWEQGGSLPGRALDNWLQATARLREGIPPHQSGERSDLPADGPAFGELEDATIGARTFFS